MRPLILTLLAAVLAAPVRADTLPGASVDSLLAAARQASPELRMARLEAEAAAERVLPAGALPDPMVRLELENITRNGSRSPTLAPGQVGDTQYTLIQPLPFWGKRDLKRAQAAAEAEAARGQAGDTWLALATRIKLLHAQRWQTHQALDLTRQNLDLTVRLARIAQARYAGGLAPQQDAIRAQVERTNLEAELLAMESERHHQMAYLNALLARPADAPLAEPTVLRPEPEPARLDPAALAGRLAERNPLLATEAALLTAAEKGRDLTYRNRYPDFTVGVSPMQVGSRVDAWNLMLEMNIPLQQDSRQSQEREAERRVEAAQARREALGHRLVGEVSAALAELEAARATATLTATRLLPQAELGFKAALAGYETGQVDFATLLEAQKQIRNARLALLRAQTARQIRLAEIERLIGEDL